MILTTVQITNFKCVRDSTPFSVDPDVTCLVGKNEAGKTTILEALHKLHPAAATGGDFDVTREYFRPGMLDYARRHPTHPETAITTTWELESDDIKALEALVGPAGSKIKTVEVKKQFDNKVYVIFPLDEAEVVSGILKSSELAPGEKTKYKAAASVKDLVAQLTTAPEEQQQRAALAATIKTRFGDNSPMQAAINLLWSRTPKFAYFNQYLRMPGQLAVDPFKQRVANNQLTEEDRVFVSLLDMIGMTVDAFVAVENYEELSARLEAATGALTRELRAFWPDGKHLRMEFRFDTALPKDPAPFNAGRIFRARIKNERYDATTGFDQRSNGFIWFFSFLVWFTQLKKNYKGPLVVLLDEPGMALHGTAQRELLRFIDERIAKEFQVIYTTHSPFMLDASRLNRARPVEDVVTNKVDESGAEVAEGTKVFEDWWSADSVTLFPMRGCLAYAITQSMFIGPHSLLVEGPADLMFIDWFKRKLASLKRPTLDRRWVITPCGSISKISAFLALFGSNHIHCAVLCDFADGQKREVRDLSNTAAACASAQVLTANQFADKPQADLEDLLGDEFYADLVNRAYGLPDAQRFVPPPPSEAGKPTGRVVKAAENHMKTVTGDIAEFTHPGPADFLLRQGLDYTGPGLDGALFRFQRLFEALNEILVKRLSAPVPPPVAR